MLAASTGRHVPRRASDAFVVRTFDDFAASFEAKLESLSYRAPALVADTLADAGLVPDGRLAVLDAGCGTGLCGPLLRPYASRLVGVDLSSGMLEHARHKQIYTDLAQAELTEFLTARRQTLRRHRRSRHPCVFRRSAAILHGLPPARCASLGFSSSPSNTVQHKTMPISGWSCTVATAIVTNTCSGCSTRRGCSRTSNGQSYHRGWPARRRLGGPSRESRARCRGRTLHWSAGVEEAVDNCPRGTLTKRARHPLGAGGISSRPCLSARPPSRG